MRPKTIQIQLSDLPKPVQVDISPIKDTILRIMANQSYNVLDYLKVKHVVQQQQGDDLWVFVVDQCNKYLLTIDPHTIDAYTKYKDIVSHLSVILSYLNQRQRPVQSTLLLLYNKLLSEPVFLALCAYQLPVVSVMMQELQQSHIFEQFMLKYLSTKSYPQFNTVADMLQHLKYELDQQLTLAQAQYAGIASKVKQVVISSILDYHLIQREFSSLLSMDTTFLFEVVAFVGDMPLLGKSLIQFLQQQSSDLESLVQIVIDALSLKMDINYYKQGLHSLCNAPQFSAELVQLTDMVLRNKHDYLQSFRAYLDAFKLFFKCILEKGLVCSLL